jgi:hypothetical protein
MRDESGGIAEYPLIEIYGRLNVSMFSSAITYISSFLI